MKLILLVLILFFAGFTYLVVTLTNNEIADIRSRGAANSQEAEGSTISGNASIQSDTNASGGRYLAFGQTTQPTTLPTPTTTALRTFYVATTGSDTNTGSQTQPFRTLQKAASLVNPGDLIIIRGGTYREYVTFSRSGTSTQRITFRGAAGEIIIFDGSSKSPQADSHGTGVFQISASFLTFENFDIIRGYSDGIQEWPCQANNNIFRDMKAYQNNTSGFNLCGNNNLVENSEAFDNTGTVPGNSDGFKVYQGSNNTVQNSITYHNADDGLDFWEGTNNTISNVKSYNNGYSGGNGNGFKLGPGGGNKISISVAYGNSTRGFDMNGGGGNLVYNNTSYNNGSVSFRSYNKGNIFKNNIAVGNPISLTSLDTHTHNTWNLNITNPGFASTTSTATNFLHLSSTSTAIDKGINVGLPFKGSAPDLGAYEF